MVNCWIPERQFGCCRQGDPNILTAVYTRTNAADLSQGGQLVITLNTNNVKDQPVVNATNNGSDTNGDSIRVRGSQLSGKNGANDYEFYRDSKWTSV